ncbi:hypothetical protein AN958_10450 [Leucoagaricus sp. SymC.cos]|nr:hypothetical protein AN958_10450 [Leucoagaricus sp. SymC.cos]
MADDGLATRRSRRSTAGNRMEAALAEMSLDETNKDLDDDNEFVNDKDEEDVFESDFASTDEEANQEDIDADEKAVHEEEKSARKAARARLEKRTAAAHAKHKATFNPQAIAPPVVKPKLTPKAVTMLDSSEPGSKAASRRAGQKRKSQRRHTVLNTSATDTRMRETEEKKVESSSGVRLPEKVLSGKGRSLGRVKQRCPITGEIAPYLDPRTGVPFANMEAYQVLTDLLEHQYQWSPELGCYVGRD